MRFRQSSLILSRFVFLVTVVLILAANSFAGTEKLIHSFLTNPDGELAEGGLVADSAGNLYGTTVRGGASPSCSCGSVFELSPPATAGGAWTETVLYSFLGGPTDGAAPYGTLIFDSAGNLYGTSQGGGTNNTGTVFELSPPATPGGAWTKTILWFFPPTLLKGYSPFGKLAMDASGNLYGTTDSGGANFRICDCGVVFELVKPKTAGGSWVERVLYNFGAVANDGTNPGRGLLLRNGVLYGTTQAGGTGKNGTVFELVRQPGLWAETIIHNFSLSDGANPLGGLIADAAGNLYGTAINGGSSGVGVIYELSPPATAGDPWQETTLYSFLGHADGANPRGALWRSTAGDLYGTANMGGAHNGGSDFNHGTAFKLKAPATAGGVWTLVLLHDFQGVGSGDGIHPDGELIQLGGLLYGTTEYGGAVGAGTVFSVVP